MSLVPAYAWVPRAKAIMLEPEFIASPASKDLHLVVRAVQYMFELNIQYRAIWNRDPDVWSAWAFELPNEISDDAMRFYAEYGADWEVEPDDHWLQFGERWCNLQHDDLTLFVQPGGPGLETLKHYRALQRARWVYQFYALGLFLEQCDIRQSRTGGKGGRLRVEGGE